jgi:hypothetical protein
MDNQHQPRHELFTIFKITFKIPTTIVSKNGLKMPSTIVSKNGKSEKIVVYHILNYF